jgi:catechol 2,3-dioxygenase-like lactoylglutathione lyase family enzyme
MEFDHYTIKVKDLEKSYTFYTEVLQLNEIENKTRKPTVRWLSVGNSQELHLVEGNSDDIKTNIGVHLAFKVKDLNPIIAHLKNNNITIYSSKGAPNETTIRPDGIMQVYFQDPDEYWIEVNDALD